MAPRPSATLVCGRAPIGPFVTRRRLLFISLGLVLAIALAVGGVVGWLWWDSRPETKLGSADVEFDTAERPPKPLPPLDLRPELPWEMYGYDAERTHFTPVHMHRPPFVRKWVVPAGDLIEFPAAVADGRVFVAAERHRFFAVDAATGKVLWNRAIRKCAASSPLVRGDVVYQSFLPWPCPHGPRDAQALVLGFDVATGKEVWRFTQAGPSESSLLIVGRLMYFGSWDARVYAIDIATRKIRWSIEVDDEVHTSPAYWDGTIFIGTNGGSIYALDAQTGATRWRGRSYSHFPRGREYFYATPALAYGRVFAGNTDGWVYAYGARTGNLIWAQRAGTYVYTAPAVWNRTVYVGSYDGKVYAFDAATGRLRWTYESPGSIHGAPTVMNGLVYFSVCGFCGQKGVRDSKRGRPSTFALDARTGALVWTFADGLYSPVIADENRVYLMGISRVWALEPCERKRDPARRAPYRGLLTTC